MSQIKEMCQIVTRHKEKKLMEKLKSFADTQIQFLESEKQIIENLNEKLNTQTLDVFFILFLINSYFILH
jgi:hypothetical protein